MEDPYLDIDDDKLILRDFLAADRTSLANERTLLAYIRTSLTFLIAGISFLKFFDDVLLIILGWCFIPAGVITLCLGVAHYRNKRRSIRKFKQLHKE